MNQWKSIEEENQAYWTNRAPSYTETIRTELTDGHAKMWGDVINAQLREHFRINENQKESYDTDPELHRLQALEVGTGPGFLSILLAMEGYEVTGVDYTKAMLEEARVNTGNAGVSVDFREMNAEALEFPDASFDLVISRNLTWNLPHPDRAYEEWIRVLKPNGMILIFDANYYNFLYDEEARAGYERDRRQTALEGEEDIYLSTDTEAMEAIARQIPFSKIVRPAWDLKFFRERGLTASHDPDIWKRVWDKNEQVNQASVPMFMIKVEK